jgi:hypothetical protein
MYVVQSRNPWAQVARDIGDDDDGEDDRVILPYDRSVSPEYSIEPEATFILIFHIYAEPFEETFNNILTPLGMKNNL